MNKGAVDEGICSRAAQKGAKKIKKARFLWDSGLFEFLLGMPFNF
jgi:hypothetical protein